jgi:hypothetical protein
MAKTSKIEKNKQRRAYLALQCPRMGAVGPHCRNGKLKCFRSARASASVLAPKREALLATANDESLSMEERFEARLKLAELPRNSRSCSS